MKVLLSSIGSRGDVQPILALAREIRASGHEARLCAAPNFKAWVEGFGIECVPIGPDVKRFASAITIPSPEQMRDLAKQSVRDQFQVIREAAQGCDVIVAAGALQIATRSIAELTDTPYLFVAYAPVAFPSLDLPPAKTRRVDPAIAADNRALWQAEAVGWNGLFLETLNEERAKLSLAPVDDIMRHIFTDKLWLATDRVLGPAPLESELRVTQPGAWFLSDDTPLPDSLRRFLDAGEPPIYFGFGSMRGADQSARMLIEAARSLGRRAILLEGWGNLAPVDTGADCIGIGEINHSELFKHVAAIVHHGGAGTTHAAARAGRPQVVIPHNYDQYYWAQRVRDLNVGMPAPGREQLTADALIEALQVALKSDTARNAEALANRMERRGAAISVQMLIEQYG
jgi:vancomycin aglycone glucosyltransferase